MVSPNAGSPHVAARILSGWKSLLRTARTAGDTVVLDRRHIYILPTRAGLMFALMLVCTLIGSINYSLSLGFGLTFLLGGLSMIAMLHTWRNLANLTLQNGKSPPVFAGQEATFRIQAADRRGYARYAIGLGLEEASTMVDVTANGSTPASLSLRTQRRGWRTAGKITVHTEFPLGLFHAWSYAAIPLRCLVYPQPAPAGLPLPAAASSASAGSGRSLDGDEDFSGLCEYRSGDSLRRVDWKASARSQQMLSKQFDAAVSDSLWLAWQSAPGRDTEQRISQLTRWVMDAHATGGAFGLRLPDREIKPACGESHYRACLEALALFGMRD